MITKLNAYTGIETKFVADILRYNSPPDRALLSKVFSNILLIHMSYSRGVVTLLDQEGDFTIANGTILRAALENFVNFFSLSQESDEVLRRYIKAINYPKNVGKEQFKRNLEKRKHYYKSPLTDKQLGEKLEEVKVRQIVGIYDQLCDYTHGNPWITSMQPNAKASFDFAFRGLVIITAGLVELSGALRVSDSIKATEAVKNLLKLVDLEDSL